MIEAPTAAAEQGGGSVTMYTQAAIQALHDAIAHEPDPDDKAVLGQCLQKILQVQAKNAQQGQAGGQGGGGQAGPPASPAGPAQAILSQLGGMGG